MQKYAAWKAADINKALREGRQPAPGSSSSPAMADAAHDSTLPEQQRAAEPDFAFPSAPATDAPSFSSSTVQGALQHLYITPHLFTVECACLPALPFGSSNDAGTPQVPRYLQSVGCLQAAGDILEVHATSCQPCRSQSSSQRPPTSLRRLRDSWTHPQRITQKPIQTRSSPAMPEVRRSSTMRSIRAFLSAVLWPNSSVQVPDCCMLEHILVSPIALSQLL